MTSNQELIIYTLTLDVIAHSDHPKHSRTWTCQSLYTSVRPPKPPKRIAKRCISRAFWQVTACKQIIFTQLDQNYAPNCVHITHKYIYIYHSNGAALLPPMDASTRGGGGQYPLRLLAAPDSTVVIWLRVMILMCARRNYTALYASWSALHVCWVIRWVNALLVFAVSIWRHFHAGRWIKSIENTLLMSVGRLCETISTPPSRTQRNLELCAEYNSDVICARCPHGNRQLSCSVSFLWAERAMARSELGGVYTYMRNDWRIYRYDY